MEDPTFLASASVIGPDGRFVLHLPVELVLALVDIQLGGEGGAQPERLTLTDIEHALPGRSSRISSPSCRPRSTPSSTSGSVSSRRCVAVST